MDGRRGKKVQLITWAAVLVLLASVTTAFAQGQGNAVITGTINDNTGVVPGATVTVTDAATGSVRTAVSDDHGVFRLISLPPAKYSIKVEMQGFKQISTDVTLLTGETRDLGKLMLEVGGRAETINVTAEVTPVQTSSSALQKNLSGDLLTSVQVKGRDIFGMLKILPGVVDAQASRDFAQWNSGRYLSINGGLSLNKNTTIDGVPSGEEGGNGTTHITPNIDSVQEVNVISSGYTAENGRQASGQVIMTTKSGTNQLKGSAWYNGRRDWMNMNDFFRIKQGSPKPPFSVNIAGFSIGGPVVIPGVVDSRKTGKKVYFFGSNESTNDVRPTAISYTNLPTALERAGDFSQSYTGNATGTIDGNFISGARNLLVLKNPNGYPDFFCQPSTGGVSGNACAGTATATNILNPKYFDPMGRSMLSLMPLPNGEHNPSANQFNTSNDTRDTLPQHTRKNYVFRMDAVLNNKVRFSGRTLIDRDDSTTYNRVAPGYGSVDNTYNGDMFSGTLVWVVKPTVVNEITSGYTADWWGFRAQPGGIQSNDYTPWYRGAQNADVGGGVMPDPPRLAAYPSQFASTDPSTLLGTNQATQLPFFPDLQFSGGSLPAGNNTNSFRPSGATGPLPRQNYNPRFTFQDDLSMVKGRHSFKFGFSMERNGKTEPGSNDVNGVFNFGDSASNPLSSGNGFANALLGVYTSYSERDYRIDREDTHWLGEGYAQDTWRVTPRLTLDYGVRFTHNGSMFETRDQNSGFNPSLYDPSQALVLYTPICTNGNAGNQPCPTANRAAVNPLTNQVVSVAFAGTAVPNVGNVSNGFFAGGIDGKKPGEYDSLKYMEYGPRFGFAWDVFGNGKTAVRGATGIFYNFFSCCNYPYNGGPLVSLSRQIINATIPDIQAFSSAGNLAVSPQGSGVPLDYNPKLYGQDIAPGPFQTSMHYQGNFAVQRDIGFSTVVEVAYVGNFGRHYYQAKTTNNVPVNAFANPANLFNNDATTVNMANFARRDFYGVGGLTYVTSDYTGLNYNSLQISAQHRLTHGLQFGAAYTLAKGMGMRGWDFMTEEVGGLAALKSIYYGPIAVAAGNDASDQGQERRHVAVFNYSYQLPSNHKPVLKYILSDWEASGVTTIVTGDAITPTCNTGSGVSGIANTDPSLSGVGGGRCDIVPGMSLTSGYNANPTGTAAIEDQLHFNVAALQRPLPTNTSFSTTGILGPGATGYIGNIPYGVLRNPGWSNWDFTMARRLPIKVGRGGNVRLQIQFYNLFNQVEFNKMAATYSFTTANATGGFGGGNTNTQTGTYTSTQNPFNAGITIRFDY